MKYSTKLSDTVHVMVLIAINQEKSLSSASIAESVHTNPGFVRQLMIKLKKAGLVETKEGIDGGYHCIEETDQISLHTIAEALDFTFVSSGWKSGSTEMKCLIASGMGGLMEKVYEDLNNQCMERLKKIAIKDLDKEIFKS